jgi:hypothetical protein
MFVYPHCLPVATTLLLFTNADTGFLKQPDLPADLNQGRRQNQRKPEPQSVQTTPTARRQAPEINRREAYHTRMLKASHTNSSKID